MGGRDEGTRAAEQARPHPNPLPEVEGADRRPAEEEERLTRDDCLSGEFFIAGSVGVDSDFFTFSFDAVGGTGVLCYPVHQSGDYGDEDEPANVFAH